jgi:hypothetical protein
VTVNVGIPLALLCMQALILYYTLLTLRRLGRATTDLKATKSRLDFCEERIGRLEKDYNIRTVRTPLYREGMDV